MKKLYLIGIFVSLFTAASCSISLPSNEKEKAKNSNNMVLGLFSLIKAASTNSAYVLVPNSDTTKPYLSLIKHSSGVNEFIANLTFETNPSDMTGTSNDHVYVVLTNANKVAVLGMDTIGANITSYISTGSRPVHIYQDTAGKIWVMNDGNSGVDNINSACNTASVGSVTIIQDGAKGATGSSAASVIKHLCVGKGHHKAIFTTSPKRAFVSNISDNTVSVIDNDPASSNYLSVINTISLGAGAGPHGFSYSSVSGKVYISAQTAGTIVAVDPGGLTTQTISTPKSGPSSAAPGGQYIAVPGNDTATDTNHVIGKITILNASTNAMNTISITDVIPDHVMFSDDGKRLFVVSAQGGSGNQVTNLKQNVLLVYDSSSLPALSLLAEVNIGNANTGHRHISSVSHGSMMHLFSPSGDGNLYTVDSSTNSVSQVLKLGGNSNNVYYHALGSAPAHSH